MIRISTLLVLVCFLSSCQKEEVVFETNPNENFELSLLLRLNGKDCAFDHESATLKYSIDRNSLVNFSPLVEFKSHSEITFEDNDLISGSNNRLGDLVLNKPYSISIKSKDAVNQFKLIFTEIPIIQIVTHDEIVNEPKTLARLTINYPEKEKTSAVNWAGIEHRGASSLKYDKKSMGIETFRDKSTETTHLASFFDLKPNNKWILDAMYVDRSRMRNKVSFDIWRSMIGLSKEPAIESRFVEVYMNFESQGLFCFNENYSEEFLGLGSEALLYKGTDNSPATKFEKLPEEKPNSLLWNKWEQVLPDPKISLHWDDFEALSYLIIESDDITFKNQIGQFIDLDNAIDYYLFINLFRGADSVGKNWFFLKRNKNSKFKILPWDMDSAWGRSIFKKEIGYSDIMSNGLFRRLRESNPEEYNQRLKSRWQELRNSVFSETEILKVFADNFSLLESYDIINLENRLWGTDLNLQEEHVYIKSWIQNRLIYLDDHFGY